MLRADVHIRQCQAIDQPGVESIFNTKVDILQPYLALGGMVDKRTHPSGIAVIGANLNRVHADWDAPHHGQLLRHDVGPMETPEGRQEILRFLERNLKL